MRDLLQRPPYPVIDEYGALVAATDWLGNEFKAGDSVIYCITAGTGGRMAIGEVLKLEMLTVPRGDGRPAWQEVRVQVLTKRTSESWDFGPRVRPTWVTAANITALPIRVPFV